MRKKSSCACLDGTKQNEKMLFFNLHNYDLGLFFHVLFILILNKNKQMISYTVYSSVMFFKNQPSLYSITIIMACSDTAQNKASAWPAIFRTDKYILSKSGIKKKWPKTQLSLLVVHMYVVYWLHIWVL